MDPPLDEARKRLISATQQEGDTMTALLIDTLSFATQLRSTGFTSQQSDGLARALYDAVLDRVATTRDTERLKQDLTELKKDVGIIKQEVEIVKQDVTIIKQEVEVLKRDVKDIKLDIVDIKRSIASLDGRLAETKIEMIKWSVGSVVGMSALVVGGLKLIL